MTGRETERMATDRDKKFRDMSIAEYTGQLGSAEPTPGGGAAAALVSAQGAALIMMVAGFTIGKARYAEFEELCISARAEAERLRDELLDAMDLDAASYGRVAEAYALPAKIEDCSEEYREQVFRYLYGEADGEAGRVADGEADDDIKAARDFILYIVSKDAADAPLDVMESSLRGLELSKNLIGHSNPNLISDIYVAARCFAAGLESAALNVEANLSAVQRINAEEAAEMLAASKGLRSKANDIMKSIFPNA